MAKFHVVGKLQVELGIIVEAEDENSAQLIAEEIDLSEWVEVNDEFEVSYVGPWVDHE